MENNTGFYNITGFGAVGDGKTDNTEYIQEAIDKCFASGGGTVFIPAGVFYTGPIRLKSRIHLNLSPGSKLLFSQDLNDYSAVKNRWEGTECYTVQPMIFADNLENVTISGDGIIDGQGESWWTLFRDYRSGKIKDFNSPLVDEIRKLNKNVDVSASGGGGIETGFLRPPLISIKNCKRVTLDGFTTQNSAFWNTHILYSDNVTINNVVFKNPDNSPNTDGLDIDSSKNVRITGCTFDVGDDCLVIKSGIDKDGRRVGIPTENIIVSNCSMVHGHGGVVFGSEGAGGIKNVLISNCIFTGTDRGIRLKSRRGRGGYLKDILIQNIYMTDVLCPFVFNLFYRCGATKEMVPVLSSREPAPVTEETPYIKNVKISHIIVRNVKSAAGIFWGLPEMPVDGVDLTDIDVEMDEVGENAIPAMDFHDTRMIKTGFVGSFMKNVTMSNVRFSRLSGNAIKFDNVDGIYMNNIKIDSDASEKSVFDFEQCSGISISNCPSVTDDEKKINARDCANITIK